MKRPALLANQSVTIPDKTNAHTQNYNWQQPFYRAVIVTSGYHVLRANIFARQLHLNLTGIGAHTPLYYLPFAMFREYLALIVMYRWANLVVVLGLAAYYVAALVRLI